MISTAYWGGIPPKVKLASPTDRYVLHDTGIFCGPPKAAYFKMATDEKGLDETG